MIHTSVKTSTITTILAVALLLNSLLIPSLSIFLLVLGLLLIVYQEKQVTVVNTAVIISAVYSLLFESPIGLLPFLTASLLFGYLLMQQRALALGISLFLQITFFIVLHLLLTSTISFVLTTGQFVFMPEILATAFRTCLVLFVLTFLISLNRKL